MQEKHNLNRKVPNWKKKICADSERASIQKKMREDAKNAIRQMYFEMLEKDNDARYCLCSFTYHQKENSKGQPMVAEKTISRAHRKLLDIVHRQFFGKDYQEKDIRLACLPVRQQHNGQSGHVHSHMFLQIPDEMIDTPEHIQEFCDFVSNQAKTNRQIQGMRHDDYGQHDVRPVTGTPERCVEYLMRSINFDDGNNDIDVDNMETTPYHA